MNSNCTNIVYVVLCKTNDFDENFMIAGIFDNRAAASQYADSLGEETRTEAWGVFSRIEEEG